MGNRVSNFFQQSLQQATEKDYGLSEKKRKRKVEEGRMDVLSDEEFMEPSRRTMRRKLMGGM